MEIAGSFLKINDNKEKIDKLNEAVDRIHFDIMDGKFTERETPQLDILKENLKDTTKKIDIHLMVIDIKKYVDEVLKFNPKFITFHYEATNDIEKIINYIKGKNVKVGLAINPETEVEKIYPYLNKIDLVLIMSVPPGKGGQKFVDVSKKIKKLKEYKQKNNLTISIEVDGGINHETINKVKDADIVVVGSYITDSDNYKETVSILKQTNKKGFTLAELLGVTVILSILSLLAFTAVDTKLKEGRVTTCKAQEKNIIEAAKTWLYDHPIDEDGEEHVSVSELQSDGYLDNDFKNPKTEEDYKSEDYVIITKSEKKYAYQMHYEDTNDQCE